MAARPAGVCLDVTRTVSRLGLPHGTGIDRVERDWLDGLLARETPLWGLARLAGGFALLDRAGLARLVRSGALPGPDLAGRLSRRLPPLRRRAESLARAVALRRGRDLARLLGASLPAGSVYLNAGHANLSAEVLDAFRPFGPRAVYLHDALPLALPDAHDAETRLRFARRLAAAGGADLLLTPSAAARDDILRHLGRAAPAAVLPPGIAPPGRPEAAAAPPYALALGTLDRRKDQALLCAIWARDPGLPPLILVGARGRGGPDPGSLPAGVTHLAGAGDGEARALLSRAAVLLHPSRGEGFGLPPLEAGVRGVPVIAADLRVYRETLGTYGVYARAGDLYGWREAIRGVFAEPQGRRAPLAWPGPEEHVEEGLRLLGALQAGNAAGEPPRPAPPRHPA